MKMFDSVVVAYDGSAFDLAMPIRAMLELYRLYVHTYYCCQKQNVLDVLAGKIPDADYVVLVTGGDRDPDKGSCIHFPTVVEQVAGEWKSVAFRIFPEDVRQMVKLKGRTVIAVGCYAGSEPLARAFLDSGCKAYIAPTGEIDMDSTTMFVCAFFHYLTVPPPDRLSDRDAVERARKLDSQTASYRYYCSD